MPKLTMDWSSDTPIAQRGDVLAFPRTRYMILQSRPVKRRDPSAGARFVMTVMREELVEGPLWQLLYRAAERRGGQVEFNCYWHPRKRKTMTFEQMMRGERYH